MTRRVPTLTTATPKPTSKQEKGRAGGSEARRTHHHSKELALLYGVERPKLGRRVRMLESVAVEGCVCMRVDVRVRKGAWVVSHAGAEGRSIAPCTPQRTPACNISRPHAAPGLNTPAWLKAAACDAGVGCECGNPTTALHTPPACAADARLEAVHMQRRMQHCMLRGHPPC